MHIVMARRGKRTHVDLALLLALLAAGLMTIGVRPAHATVGQNDYPSNLANAAQDSLVDPWGFYNRECVSFVAWRLYNDDGVSNFSNNMTGPNSVAGHWGNAYQWSGNATAIGYTFNSTPANGSVAQWAQNYHGAGSAGHVAYVDTVNADGLIVVEEYNHDGTGHYDTRTIASGSSSWPSGFIHINDQTSAPPSPPPPVPWNFENLDGDSGSILGHNYDLGQSPAEVQYGNTLQVFYSDYSNGYLRHAWSDSSGWHSEILDGAGGSNGRISANLGSFPVATVYNNTLQLFYYDATDHALRHAWSDSSGWHFETLDGAPSSYSGHSSADVGRTASVVVNGTSLQLFYYDSTNGNLRHAWSPNGTTWNFENLDGDPGSIGHLDANVGQDPTSVVDSNGVLQLFYYDVTNGNLRHAWSDSTGWHFENLDGDPGSLGHLDANLGANPVTLVFGSTLQVFYYDVTNGNLRHAWSDSSGWHFETLDGDAGSISGYSSDVGSMPTATVLNGVLQVFYYEAGGGNLRHAWSDANGWHFETLDGTGGQPTGREDANVGTDPVALAYSGVVELFYYDVTNGNLRHVWSQ